MQIRDLPTLNADGQAQSHPGIITEWLESVGIGERRRLFVELVRMDCVLCEKLSAGYAGNESVQRLALLRRPVVLRRSLR